MSKLKQVTLRLTSEELEALQAAAERDLRSVNDQIRWAIKCLIRKDEARLVP